MLKKVLFAVDFSPFTEKMLDCAGELVAVGMNEMVLLHVIDAKMHAEYGDHLSPAYTAMEEEARRLMDLLAERVTALGGAALGTVRMAAEATTLPEYPLETVQGHEVVDLMVERWAAYAASTDAIERGEPPANPGKIVKATVG